MLCPFGFYAFWLLDRGRWRGGPFLIREGGLLRRGELGVGEVIGLGLEAWWVEFGEVKDLEIKRFRFCASQGEGDFLEAAAAEEETTWKQQLPLIRLISFYKPVNRCSFDQGYESPIGDAVLSCAHPLSA